MRSQEPTMVTKEEAAACTHPDMRVSVENDLGWLH